MALCVQLTIMSCQEYYHHSYGEPCNLLLDIIFVIDKWWLRDNRLEIELTETPFPHFLLHLPFCDIDSVVSSPQWLIFIVIFPTVGLEEKGKVEFWILQFDYSFKLIGIYIKKNQERKIYNVLDWFSSIFTAAWSLILSL